MKGKNFGMYEQRGIPLARACADLFRNPKEQDESLSALALALVSSCVLRLFMRWPMAPCLETINKNIPDLWSSYQFCPSPSNACMKMKFALFSVQKMKIKEKEKREIDIETESLLIYYFKINLEGSNIIKLFLINFCF